MMEWNKKSGKWAALTLFRRSRTILNLIGFSLQQNLYKSLDDLSECRTIAHFFHLNILLGIS